MKQIKKLIKLGILLLIIGCSNNIIQRRMLKFIDWTDIKLSNKNLDYREMSEELIFETNRRKQKINYEKNDSIQIFVKGLNNKTIVLDCNINDTVDSIKYQIQDVEGLNPKDFFIIYSNKILDCNIKLSKYGILSKDCLNIFCRIRGGANSGLSILIKCEKCDHKFWKKINERKFTLGEDIYRCMKCNEISGVKALKLINCIYTLKGLGEKNGKAYINHEVENKPEILDLDIDKWFGLSITIHKETNGLEKLKELLNNNNNKNDKNIYNILIQNSFNDNSNNSDNSIRNSYNDNRKYDNKTEANDNSWNFSLKLWPF